MRLLECEQYSPEWWGARCGLPTASCMDRIITRTGKPSSSADDYIAELIDEVVRPFDERDEAERAAHFSGNRHTERGRTLEPYARNWYRLVTHADVREIGMVLRDDGLAGCSPDSLVWTDAPIRGVEIKAPEGKKHVRWMMGGGLPDEHAQQVHGSMAITGLRRWTFLSYCPGYKPFRADVEWDDYTDKVAEALESFIKRLAEAKRQFIEYIPNREAA